MPYDAGVAAAIKHELNEKLFGGRIEKITQPTKEEIIFHIYSKSEHFKLMLDANDNSPKVYITKVDRENPPVPPMFCNILRKYLQNAKISDISQVGFDRIFEFKFDAFDEMGFTKPLYLYVECIRKQSNIILCGEHEEKEGVRKIIASVKSVDFSLSEKRQILPGLAYAPPPVGDLENKLNPLEATKERFLEDFISAAQETNIPLENYLLSKYQGFSPLITREIAFLSCDDTSVLINAAIKNSESVWFYFNSITQKVCENHFTPTLLYKSIDKNDRNDKDDKNNKDVPRETPEIFTDNQELSLMDFSYVDIRQYGSKAVSKTYNSVSELIDYFFFKKDYDNRIRQKSQDILKVLLNASSRINKKIKLLEKDLEECNNKEKIKIYGDLITANIYRLGKGMNTLETENYYDENKIIKIPLNVNLTPPQNAQKYYKRYSKLKTAEVHITIQLENARNDITYIDSVFDSLTRALSERELAEIRDELTESGIIKKRSAKTKSKSGKKPKQLSVSKPEEFKSTNGFKILCGKNNKQNDDLTFRIAGKNDIWFHTQKIPGSHTVLLCGSSGKEPSDKDIEDAARIAATYSKGKNMPLVPVDYTSIRYVKKPSGAKPGFVIYTNFKTANVKPVEITSEKI